MVADTNTCADVACVSVCSEAVGAGKAGVGDTLPYIRFIVDGYVVAGDRYVHTPLRWQIMTHRDWLGGGTCIGVM